MRKHIYLYQDPFIIKRDPATQAEFLSDTIRLTDSERADEMDVRNHLLKFALTHNLITSTNGQLMQSREKNMASWIWLCNWGNFRALVDSEQYHTMLHILSNDNGRAMILLLELHSMLGMMFDHRLLNTIADRTMLAIQMIPYPVPADHETVSWEVIHKQAPWVWLLCLIQMTIRTEAKE